jgi:hypothetical protein
MRVNQLHGEFKKVQKERVAIARSLERGICGDFAKGLGKSLIHADSGNLHLIAKTWPEIIIQAHRLAVSK